MMCYYNHHIVIIFCTLLSNNGKSNTVDIEAQSSGVASSSTDNLIAAMAEHKSVGQSVTLTSLIFNTIYQHINANPLYDLTIHSFFYCYPHHDLLS